MVLMLASLVVNCMSKLQPNISISSTECELIAAVQAAKVGRDLCSILAELANEAVIHLINNAKPTARVRSSR